MSVATKLRKVSLLLPILFVATMQTASMAKPVCVIDRQDVPKSWAPQNDVVKKIKQTPWSETEELDANNAAESGLKEIINYLERKPKAIADLWDDSIESVLNIAHGKPEGSEIPLKAKKAGRTYLDLLIAQEGKKQQSKHQCADVGQLLPLAIFAHRLLATDDPRTINITKRANIALQNCKNLPELFELEDNQIPPTHESELTDLYSLVIWNLWLVEAQVYPDIKLPKGAAAFPEQFWNMFKSYRFKDPDEFDSGEEDEDFLETAEIVTHLALIPSGTSRYPLFIEDLPGLHRFLRENFYTIVGSDDLDMLASFVDSLRQYGCTPVNDLQVRDGTRMLLQYFHDSDDRWMNYRNPDDEDTEPSDYDIIHKAWTGAMAVKARRPQIPSPGNYGGVVRNWLPFVQ